MSKAKSSLLKQIGVSSTGECLIRGRSWLSFVGGSVHLWPSVGVNVAYILIFLCCVLIFFVLCLVCATLPVSFLDCPFFMALRFSLTFIYIHDILNGNKKQNNPILCGEAVFQFCFFFGLLLKTEKWNWILFTKIRNTKRKMMLLKYCWKWHLTPYNKWNE
jgi:hypothetical protein